MDCKWMEEQYFSIVKCTMGESRSLLNESGKTHFLGRHQSNDPIRKHTHTHTQRIHSLFTRMFAMIFSFSFRGNIEKASSFGM